jgi:hypothetical protein
MLVPVRGLLKLSFLFVLGLGHWMGLIECEIMESCY